MKITIAAHAKLNLSLFITGRLENGYHTLDTIMQSISISDRVTISTKTTQGIQVRCSNPNLSGRENLAYTATELYLKAIDHSDQGIQIEIEKQIPLAGGLGGGSADAAAVLIGLNHLFDSPLSLTELQSIALSLGADVPFCLVGGTCRATGIGEVLQPLDGFTEDIGVVCIKPCHKLSTGEMYRKYDENKGLPYNKKCDIISFNDVNELNFWPDLLKNDFLPLYDSSQLQLALNRLRQLGALGTGLSGSGPTVFGVFPNHDSAKQAFKLLTAEYDVCHLAHFVNCGYEIVDGSKG